MVPGQVVDLSPGEGPVQSAPDREPRRRPLRACSYEDRPEAMDGLILMGESLCRAEPGVELHLTVPNAPPPVLTWAARRPGVVVHTAPPEGVTGWDVKPWLLLRELDAGRPEALWLDTDMIVTRPLSALLREFPADDLVVAEEWNAPEPMAVSDFWDLPLARRVRPVNSCLVRATTAHRPLLGRWLRLVHDSGYRAAQALPFERRPFHLASDQVLLTALLGGEEFGNVAVSRIRMGRHIAQCAGSSGYRPLHRLLDLFRGLPPLVHCIGRKPWASGAGGRGRGFLTDLSDDVSPYVLAARRVARDLDLAPGWLRARTLPGALMRGLSVYHPALAGLPLAILHSCHMRVSRTVGFGPKTV